MPDLPAAPDLSFPSIEDVITPSPVAPDLDVPLPDVPDVQEAPAVAEASESIDGAGLTDEAELLLDSGTYGERSTSSARLPGAVLENLRFVL